MLTNSNTMDIYDNLLKEVAPLPCQNEYAKELCSLMSFHIKKNELMDAGISPSAIPSQGALVVAPTGAGKTYLMTQLGKICDVNIIFIDASSLTKEGYKGMNLSQVITSNRSALGNEQYFERSILFIDEFDKLMSNAERGYDTCNPIANLLQLFNGGCISLENSNRDIEKIDVSRFTIILAGAFSGIEKIVKKRVEQKTNMGFIDSSNISSINNDDYMSLVTIKDLEDYGIMLELLGRITSLIHISRMNKNDYISLLSNHKGSITHKWANYLWLSYGIQLIITDEAIEFIANKCTNIGTGARAASSLINDLLRSSCFDVEKNKKICKVVIDVKDNECIANYKYGARELPYLELSRNRSSKRKFIIAGDEKEIINQLMDYLKNDSMVTKESISIYKTFLCMSISYLHKNCNPDDRNMISLHKLCHCTEKKNKNDRSTLDIMMEQIDSDDIETIKYYKKFIKDFDGSTTNTLNRLLDKTDEEIRKVKGPGIHVEFAIEKLSKKNE